MRLFIIDIYKVFYRLSGNRLFSVFSAVVYTSGLNLLTLCGLTYLLKSVVPLLVYVQKLFSTPLVFFTVIAMLGFNLWLLMPFKDLSKGKMMKPLIAPIIVYSCVAVMLFLFGCFMDDVKF